MKTSKKVVDLTHGTVYDSVAMAADTVGCTKAAIYNSIKLGKRVKGTLWAWADTIFKLQLAIPELQPEEISLCDKPTKEEAQMLLYRLVRIRARARRCYRKNHGHLGTQSCSDTCYRLSELIHVLQNENNKSVPYFCGTWLGIILGIGYSREDMILTGGRESVEDVMAILAYMKAHGDEHMKNEVEEFTKKFLYAESQIQLIRESRPCCEPDATYAADLQIRYGICYSCKDDDSQYEALTCLIQKEIANTAKTLEELKSRTQNLLREIRELAEEEC